MTKEVNLKGNSLKRLAPPGLMAYRTRAYTTGMYTGVRAYGIS